MMTNAIILAAGKSNKCLPFTFEKPKGLFSVKGKILIERQIEQLIEAGIKDIYIVVGYMKEKFFYLEQKYPNVYLLSNNKYDEYGNLYSLYMARTFLKNTYICCVDHYFVNNPFIQDLKNKISYRLCSYHRGKFKEFAVKISNENIITEVKVGGSDSYAMVGYAYFNETFSKKFKQLLENEINDFGVAHMFWEEFYAKHMRELTLMSKCIQQGELLEFENIDDLREFDSDFLRNVDSDIIGNICRVLRCEENSIQNISIINAGLTNVSFAYEIENQKYVYRHPGASAINLVDRKTECIVQKLAKKLGIDESFVYIDSAGWKISRYIPEARECNFEGNQEQLSRCFENLHKLHKQKINEGIKVFDNVVEGKRLLEYASITKGNLKREFSQILLKIDILDGMLKKRAAELGIHKVICHNDVYEPNFIYDDKEKFYLIDWEYGGLNYAANDVGTILCRRQWDDEQVEKIIKLYLGENAPSEMIIFYKAFIPISAFYWFCWGLYKGSVGEDDSFFFLPAYRNLIKYIDSAIEGLKVK